jgi:hypothetical protein
MAAATPSPPYQVDFKNPDYRPIFLERTERLKWLRANPAKLKAVKAYYKDHIADFISDWAITVDPRVSGKGRNPVMPLILMPKQRELVEWIIAMWKGGDPGVLVKSRDVGASWIAFAVAVSLCLFHRNMMLGFGSATEDKLDSTTNPDTLFFKGRMFLENLPEEFRAGWNVKKHSTHMGLTFPETRSSISGDAGDRMGRGGRKAIFFVDEAAHLMRPAVVDAAISMNTDCRIDMSSVNGSANPFADKARRYAATKHRFDFNWYDDLRKDEAWLERKRYELDPITFNQEIMNQFDASMEGIVIPYNYVQAAIDAHVKLGWTISGMKLAGLDIADRGKDKNAIAIRHGILIKYAEMWTGKDSDLYETAERAFSLCDRFETPEFAYDGDGMGVGIRGDARKINEGRKLRRIRTVRATMYRGSASPVDPEAIAPGTDRTNEDYYKNMKAQAWFTARWRFRNTWLLVESAAGRGDPSMPLPRVEDCISLASGYQHFGQLVTELSQAQYKQDNSGKMLIDKAPQEKLKMASPNLADAVVIAMAPRIGRLVITEETLQQTSAAGARAAPGNPGGFRFPRS